MGPKEGVAVEPLQEVAAQRLPWRVGDGMDDDVDAPQASATRAIAASIWSSTSHCTVRQSPTDGARPATSRARCSFWHESPRTAPSRWKTRAIPQAMDCEVATPMTRALLPSISPLQAIWRRSRLASFNTALALPGTLRPLRTTELAISTLSEHR